MTPAVRWLIGVSVALHFLQLTVIQPEDLQLALGFRTSAIASHWWTVATYMFVHGGFWHLALNMYTLWIFGPRLEAAWSTGEFVRYYLWCGLGGWFVHLFVAGDAVLIGASAAVLGVMLAYASAWPRDEVYLFGVIPLSMRALMVVLVVMNLAGGATSEVGAGGVAYLAHLGGLGAGWIYLRTLHAFDLRRWTRGVAPVADPPDEESMPRAVPRGRAPRTEAGMDDIVAQSQAATAQHSSNVSAAPPMSVSAERSALDNILDKISAQGIESLTATERRILDDASRRLRDH